MANLFAKGIEEFLAKFKEEIKEEILSELKKETTPSPDLFTEKEICKLTYPAIPRSTINTWVNKGKITAYKVGKRTYYSKNEALAFLTRCKKLPKTI
jgi:excisionase family DNA binding protein